MSFGVLCAYGFVLWVIFVALAVGVREYCCDASAIPCSGPNHILYVGLGVLGQASVLDYVPHYLRECSGVYFMAVCVCDLEVREGTESR